MRCTAPKNSKAGREARTKAVAYGVLQRIRLMIEPMRPVGTMPRMKTGNWKLSATKIQRRAFA